MSMYNLIFYADNYLKTFGSLHCKDIPLLINNSDVYFYSFIFKAKLADHTDDDEKLDNVEIMLLWKNLSNF